MVGVKKKTRWLALIGTAAAAVGVLSVVTGGVTLPGLATSRPDPAPHDASIQAPQAVTVTVVPVTPRPVRRTVQIVGTFYGHDEVTITPKVEGRVARIYHDVGDVVKPGDVLLEVEDIDYRLAVAEAQRALELELAKLGLKELPAKDFDVARVPTVVRAEYLERNAQAKVARSSRLRGAGANALEDYEQAQTDYNVAQATYQQMVMEAQATLAAARHKQALLDTARQRLAETKVLVPDLSPERLRGVGGRLAGTAPKPYPAVEYVVAQRMASEGEMVRAFPSVAVFRLVMDRPLKLLATVPERYVGDLQVGQPVEIRVEAYPNETFQGTVARVNPTVDRANRTFGIEVLVPNESRRLKAGSFAKASVFTREDAQAPTIPEEALVTFAGVTKVFVVQDSKARAVKVKPGVRLDVPRAGRVERWVEVLGEIPSGSPVVTSGQTQLAEDTPVRVRSPHEAK
jgi:multidrug efflux pump subunit AcrA (membrane-fusion protein)